DRRRAHLARLRPHRGIRAAGVAWWPGGEAVSPRLLRRRCGRGGGVLREAGSDGARVPAGGGELAGHARPGRPTVLPGPAPGEELTRPTRRKLDGCSGPTPSVRSADDTARTDSQVPRRGQGRGLHGCELRAVMVVHPD